MSFTYPPEESPNIIYVGGFDDQITEEKIHNAFICFGPIKEVFIPYDRTAEGGHKGFGFVVFEDSDDAKSAMENMHMNEIYGQIIKCNLAKPTKISTHGIFDRPGLC